MCLERQIKSVIKTCYFDKNLLNRESFSWVLPLFPHVGIMTGANLLAGHDDDDDNDDDDDKHCT